MRKNIFKTLVTFTGAVAMAGCLGSAPSGGGTDTPAVEDPSTPSTPSDPSGEATGKFNPPASTPSNPTDPSNNPTDPGTGSTDPQPQAPDPAAALKARVLDYGAALRTASLKLVGSLPTIDEQLAVSDKATYEAQIDKYLADPRFARQMLSYWQDTMKLGGPAVTTQGAAHPSFDTAPTFAAQLTVADRAITELFTATTNTCPTLNVQTGDFTDGACAVANGLTTAGVLTDPGVQSQFFSNMAFRRVRWVQETFVCSKFPAEYTATPVAKGNGQYVSPWNFDSITGGTDRAVAPIDFKDYSAVVCANCHTTMNHIAPLFANFDAQGVFQTAIQVKTPVLMTPTTKMSDWLPAGEVTSWRFGKPVANLTELGAAMAADQNVAACFVARGWNWAMNKTDIVDDAAVVPGATIDSLVQAFIAGGYKFKAALKGIFTHDDFVMF
jgi:hypothetical protein